MKMMKLALTCLLLVSCTPFQSITAATLHAIIAADLEDDSIGEGTMVDLRLVQNEVQKFAIYAGMELSETILAGNEYRAYYVLQALDTLDVRVDDVVLYYHLSHGFRTPSTTSPFPILYFGWNQWSLDMQDIIVRLKRMPQRLTIAVADVCNNMIPELESPPIYYQLAPASIRLKEFCRHLFRDFSGTIFACGAHPGEYSWINEATGSFFTKSLMDSIAECSLKRSSDWLTVFTLAQRKTLALSKMWGGDDLQHPYVLLDLKALR